MKLAGKIVLITGSSQGIGKATAVEFCKKGATVILNGRNERKLRKAELDLQNKGFSVYALQGDITDKNDCTRLMEEIVARFGALDVLINNASVTMQESVQAIDLESFENIFNSNAIGSVFPTLAALPLLKKSGGSVLFISSLAGLHAMPSASAYSMGKMSLTAFWQSLQIELSRSGIHAAICYVSFTQNEQSKRMMSANGQLVEVPKRPKFLVQSREKVGRTLVRMIRYRRSKRVLSIMGKLVAFMFRYFPKTTLLIMRSAQKAA